MIGKRLPDHEFPTNPGEYSKMIVPVGLEDGTIEKHECWIMIAPDGGSTFIIGKPNSNGSAFHWVRENEDGTITVEPNPPDAPDDRRNSNSIQAPNGWHGYIYNGEWRAA